MAIQRNHANERTHRWQSFISDRGLAPSGDDGPASALRIARMELESGRIAATVLDKEMGECHLSIEMPEWTDDQWANAIELLSRQAIFTAQMLAGDFPDELEALLQEENLALLPEPFEHVMVSCSGCQVNRSTIEDASCPHAVTVLRKTGDMLAEDAWLLFLLRGRMRQQVLRALRRIRGQSEDSNGASHSGGTPQIVQDQGAAGQLNGFQSAQATIGDVRPLEEEVNAFWGSARTQEQFRPHIVPPLAELVLLRRLGPPAFSHANGEVYDALVEIYKRVTEAALALAYADDPPVKPVDQEAPDRE